MPYRLAPRPRNGRLRPGGHNAIAVAVEAGGALADRKGGPALASYERLLKLHPQDRSVRLNVARMHRLKANLSRFLDQAAEAEKSYQEASRHYRQLAAEYPEESSLRERSALVARELALHLQRLGRYQEGSRILDASIRLSEELQAANPDEPNYGRVLALTLLTRSDWDSYIGQLPEVVRAARRSAELDARRADTPGTRPEPVDPLFHAMAVHNLAIALREQGQLDDAVAAHDRAVERTLGLTKVSYSRDPWAFYYHTRTARA